MAWKKLLQSPWRFVRGEKEAFLSSSSSFFVLIFLLLPSHDWERQKEKRGKRRGGKSDSQLLIRLFIACSIIEETREGEGGKRKRLTWKKNN